MQSLDGHILVVDDDASIQRYLSALLQKHNYPVIVCGSAREAVVHLEEAPIVALFTDIMMPDVSGIELLERSRRINPDVPVILMTGYAELDMAIESVNKGAFMFLKKPFEQSHLLAAVERALEHYRLVQNDKTYMARLEDTVFKKTRELQDTATMANKLSLELVQRLSAVAEFRDSYTAAHISRIGFYSHAISAAMGRYKEFIDAITLASSLHDIGKIGIPDKVLLKKTPLTTEERDIMKEHTLIGSKILAESSHPTIQMAASIALNHHERWNGSGYPNGLKGKEIPIEARIVSLADQYDALRSKRTYKPALEHQEAFKIITEGDERSSPDHLDPEVLEIFRSIDKELDVIFTENPDIPAAVAGA